MRKCPKCEQFHENRGSYCKPCRAAYARENRPKHSELSPEARRRANCRSYTNMLIKRGELQRMPCVSCGKPNAQAHHPDYDDPRRVTWLCKDCHGTHHVQAEPDHWPQTVVPGERARARIWWPTQKAG